MPPQSNNPRLNTIHPDVIAMDVASRVADHVSGLILSLLRPAYDGMHTPQKRRKHEDLLRETQIYWTVRALANYAVGKALLDAPVHEYLISLIPLYQSAVGNGTEDVDGLVDHEPESALGVVIAAARAREKLSTHEPLTVGDVAVLASCHRDHVTLLASKGEIPGAYRVDGKRGKEWRFSALEVHEWLQARGCKFVETPKSRSRK